MVALGTSSATPTPIRRSWHHNKQVTDKAHLAISTSLVSRDWRTTDLSQQLSSFKKFDRFQSLFASQSIIRNMFSSKLLFLAVGLCHLQTSVGSPVNAVVFDPAETNIGTKAQFEAGLVSWFWSNAQGVPVASSQRKRQSGQYITNTHLVGDGNPHQNRKLQQVTQESICPGEECSASKTESTTVGYSVSIGGQYGWINGGFSVSESKTDGESHACPNSGHDSVCVWRDYQVTAYTVVDTTCYYFNGFSSMCSPDTNQRVIYSPNDCQNDSPYLCKYDAECTFKDDSYLVTDGPAGGPPSC